ncbi:MAG: 6,7-dimethyl-8-ribityllumazine synthase [Phycisphaerae bacterium]
MATAATKSNEIRGDLSAANLRCAVVVSRYHEMITRKLLDGAVDAILRNGGKNEAIARYWTAGAFELPIAARRLAALGKTDAIILLGCVIRGETPHFDYVAAAAADGAVRVALDYDLPVSFGVLTTETMDQAQARAGGKVGNKGAEAALAAIETANLLRRMSGSS